MRVRKASAISTQEVEGRHFIFYHILRCNTLSCQLSYLLAFLASLRPYSTPRYKKQMSFFSFKKQHISRCIKQTNSTNETDTIVK